MSQLSMFQAPYTWVEPFAGAAAVALHLVDSGLRPPVSWMGGKRRFAVSIAAALRVPLGPPSRVLLADAGPWGWVWPLLLDPISSADVCRLLRSWQGENPRDLWDRLAAGAPNEEPCVAAAQWLWLQARSASGVPVWWSGSGWSGSEGTPRNTWERWGKINSSRGSWCSSNQKSRADGEKWVASDGRGHARPVGQKGGGRVAKSGSARAGQAPCTPVDGKWDGSSVGGMIHPSTVALRVEAICSSFSAGSVAWHVHHGSAVELEGMIGSSDFCYLDPPYQGATGYGWDCPRSEVLWLAEALRARGARVAVSESAPLPLPGWTHLDLTRPGRKPEWLTISPGGC